VNAGTSAYIDEVIAELRGEPRFVLVTRGDGRDIARFILERLGAGSFSQRRAVVEGVYVAIFDRARAPAGGT
jgi:hypothetical protein